MLSIIILLLLFITFFSVIILPLFLQPTEKLNLNKQKQESQVGTISAKEPVKEPAKELAKEIAQTKQIRLKEIEQDFDQGKIDRLEYQKLVLVISKKIV